MKLRAWKFRTPSHDVVPSRARSSIVYADGSHFISQQRCDIEGLRLGVVAMDGVGRERGETDGDVLGATGLRRAVTDPFARMCHDRLAGPHVEHAARVLDADQPLQDDRDLLELRPLSGLEPSFR